MAPSPDEEWILPTKEFFQCLYVMWEMCSVWLLVKALNSPIQTNPLIGTIVIRPHIYAYIWKIVYICMYAHIPSTIVLNVMW